MATLGETLKRARSKIKLTLRQIEETSGISNAYLSQLENDKIKMPSANILYRISTIYEIELNDLLIAAGIIEKVDKKKEKKKKDFMEKIAFSADKLNNKQKNSVLEYLEFIKSRKI